MAHATEISAVSFRPQDSKIDFLAEGKRVTFERTSVYENWVRNQLRQFNASLVPEQPEDQQTMFAAIYERSASTLAEQISSRDAQRSYLSASFSLGPGFVSPIASLVGWCRQLQSVTARDFLEALEDLLSVETEAREEGYRVPSAEAVANATRLLQRLYQVSGRRYEVYPTLDGEVAIDAPDGTGQSVLVLCESSGEVLCMANLISGNRYARYSSASSLPDGFVAESLSELQPGTYAWPRTNSKDM